MTILHRPFSVSTLLLAAAVAATTAPGRVQAQDAVKAAIPAATVECGVPAELTRLAAPLARSAKRLASGEPLKIVAIGSSSTAGAGASSPAHSYPSRLAVELAALFPKQQISVVNHGVNGEETPDMLARVRPRRGRRTA